MKESITREVYDEDYDDDEAMSKAKADRSDAKEDSGVSKKQKNSKKALKRGTEDEEKLASKEKGDKSRAMTHSGEGRNELTRSSTALRAPELDLEAQLGYIRNSDGHLVDGEGRRRSPRVAAKALLSMCYHIENVHNGSMSWRTPACWMFRLLLLRLNLRILKRLGKILSGKCRLR
eukprot:TRINITY_DN832_c0_g1_i11.p1 TRINITY_DN832_c0_g1~~TRINITY_DN832_c0_g1_i11.p1  ORF type:complete len:176 (-),score=26.91 TRINITY_DN832_c0_g1_i11:1068-1595(-)